MRTGLSRPGIPCLRLRSTARALAGSKGLAPGHVSWKRLLKGRKCLFTSTSSLARQDITSQQVDTLVENFKGIIENNGGKVEKVEGWGLKTLAYRIKKNRKAHFTLLNLDAPPAAVKEMERQMGINEDVLRFMTIKVEALGSRALRHGAEA